MERRGDKLSIFLFPFLAHGHMIPMVDMAKLFAAKGVKATIITTPLNGTFISKAIGKAQAQNNYEIHIQTIELPFAEAGLPEGCEKMDLVPSPHLIPAFIGAMKLFQNPIHQLLQQHRPDCIVADFFFPWATHLAAKFGIPRIVFHGTCFFSLCALNCTTRFQPYKSVSSDSEPFIIPDLPGEIKITRMQLPDVFMSSEETDLSRFREEAREAERKSFGVIVNSFYELENEYADYYRNVIGRKAWHIGPTFLCNKDVEEKAYRGKEASIDENECLKWLDTKKPNSVIYVSFGSEIHLPNSQLREIAMGLEASGQQFIWVVKKSKKSDGEEEWLPEGFERRMEGKGVIIRGWAPQILILEHEAVGGFVSHCGWNSTLEAVAAGVPLVTWPITSDEFYNEKLVTEVVRVGVPVGAKKRANVMPDDDGDDVKWDVLEKAVKKIMVEEEAEGFRNRAKALAHMANLALEQGGSSYKDLNALIQELALLAP